MNQDVAIADILYVLVHVMYTVLHFFFYCYIGDQLLTEVSVFFRYEQYLEL